MPVLSEADEVYFAAMGLVVRLIPAPVTAFGPGACPDRISKSSGLPQRNL
jgi:hypothetical protein